MTRTRITLGAALLSVGVVLGSVIRALASGIPAANALTYAGVLEDSNGPVTGMHNVQVIFYDAASAGNNLCQSTTAAVNVTSGHFSVQLPDTCTSSVGGNSNVWVDVLVDGSDTGRTKIGAVPYAVEANHTLNADNAANAANATNATTAATAQAAGGALAQQIVPSGAVMAFNLASCPAGWSAYGAAAGRTIIGVTSGAALGATLGSDQVTLTVAQMPAHAHTASDSGHTHGLQAPGQALLVDEYPTDCTGNGYQANGAVITGGNPASNICGFTGVGTGNANISVASTGGGGPFDNRQASLALTYCVKN